MLSRLIHRKSAFPVICVAALALGFWWGLQFQSPVRAEGVRPVAGSGTVQIIPAQAQAEENVYSDDGPIVRVVEKVKDAVVNIEADSDSGSEAPDPEGWLPFFHPPTGRMQSFGSGFFVDAEGTILTNAHVLGNADHVTVRLSDEHEYEATILGTDPETDLAVLRISAGHKVPYIELGDSDRLKIGQWVVAIGNPFPSQRLDRTVTVGVVSGIGRSALYFGSETPRYQNYIQTDAAINPGNSGGPLVDLSGRAIGINAAIASPSGGNVGIGFAIPVSYVRAVLKDLIAEGHVTRGWLGIQPVEITPDLAEAMELKDTRGVVVQSVVKDAPAERYGLKQGDVIVRFNGETVSDVQQFMFLVAQTPPDTEVDIAILRAGEPRSLKVRLAERDATVVAEVGRRPETDSSDSWFGMSVRTATPELAERFSVNYEPGVIVTDVEAGSPADQKEVTRGDIVTSIERQPVTSAEDFRRVRDRYRDLGRPVLFLVQGNDGQPRFVALKAR
jgi:serine protease Do